MTRRGIAKEMQRRGEIRAWVKRIGRLCQEINMALITKGNKETFSIIETWLHQFIAIALRVTREAG